MTSPYRLGQVKWGGYLVLHAQPTAKVIVGRGTSQHVTMTRATLRSPRTGVLRTQKLKTSLLRTQRSKVLPFKPSAGPYIAMHATSTARDFFLANFYPSSPPTGIPPPKKKNNNQQQQHKNNNTTTTTTTKTLSRAFPVLAVANTGSCVGPRNKIGHPAHRYRQLTQVPVLSATINFFLPHTCQFMETLLSTSLTSFISTPLSRPIRSASRSLLDVSDTVSEP